MAYYKCPVCGEKLSLNGNSYVCPSRHTFDVAKEGYVNFLTAKDKHAKSPGDNKEMILSRRAIMDEGYYRPISDYVTSEYSLDGTTVLDVGCGEGYLTREISKYCSCYGIDISKEAIRLCAKADKKIFYSVASMTRLPFFDNEFDFVFSLFAPYHAEEIARVLKGKFIVCTPDKRHLFELKEMLLITNKYKNFSDFKRFVIDPAVKDINEHSTLKVSYETDGVKGRKVNTITFTCYENYLLADASENVKKAFEELIYYKVNKEVALNIVKKYSLERIENNIQYIITTYTSKNKKTSFASLIVAAIKEDYAGNSWGLQSVSDEKVEQELNESTKNSSAYDSYIQTITTKEAAEKLIELVKEKTESTLFINQLKALEVKYKDVELVQNKLFKSIAIPVLVEENII